MGAGLRVGVVTGWAWLPGGAGLHRPHLPCRPSRAHLPPLSPPPPAQWEMDDTAEYVSSARAGLLVLSAGRAVV